MSSNISIEGFDNIITEAVEKRIEISIAEAMESQTDGIVERLVKAAMQTKVKDNRGYRDVPFMQKLARDTIHAATQAAMEEWVAEAAPLIKAELEKQIGTARFRKDFATAILDSVTREAKATWWTVKTEFSPLQKT